MSWLLTPADPLLTFIAPQPVDRSRPEARLDRFPPDITRVLAGQIGPLANLRSSTGCGVTLATDSPWIDLHLDRLRHHQPIAQGVALEVDQADGTWLGVESPDLREQEGTVNVRLPTGLRPGDVRTCTLWMPPISTAAVAGVSVAHDAQIEAVEPPTPRWLAIGDSLTQGFSTQSPRTTWVHRLMRRWQLPAWNLGIGGLLIEPDAFRWALSARPAAQPWHLITVSLGSNNGWRESTAEIAADQAAILAELVLAAGPQHAVWCLPPWKPMEDGKGPPEFMGIPLDRDTGLRIGRIREAIRARIARYPAFTVVDNLLPKDHRWYADGLHPGAWGCARYAETLAAEVEPRLLA